MAVLMVITPPLATPRQSPTEVDLQADLQAKLQAESHAKPQAGPQAPAEPQPAIDFDGEDDIEVDYGFSMNNIEHEF